MTGARWYVVRTKPRSESLAAREIGRDDIEIFSPLITSDQINNCQTPVPLFPGYIFMRVDPESYGWPSFRWRTPSSETWLPAGPGAAVAGSEDSAPKR